MPGYQMKVHINIKFRRKLVLEDMVQSFRGCHVGRSGLFQRKWWCAIHSHRKDLYTAQGLLRTSVALNISGFVSWWLPSLASLGFVKSLWEARSRSVGARITAEWRSRKSLCSKVSARDPAKQPAAILPGIWRRRWLWLANIKRRLKFFLLGWSEGRGESALLGKRGRVTVPGCRRLLTGCRSCHVTLPMSTPLLTKTLTFGRQDSLKIMRGQKKMNLHDVGCMCYCRRGMSCIIKMLSILFLSN